MNNDSCVLTASVYPAQLTFEAFNVEEQSIYQTDYLTVDGVMYGNGSLYSITSPTRGLMPQTLIARSSITW